MPSDFDEDNNEDNDDNTPLITKTPRTTTPEQEYKRLALQREADVNRLRRLLDQAEAKGRQAEVQIRQLQQELGTLRTTWRAREVFFAALQRTFSVLEARAQPSLSHPYDPRLIELAEREEIFFCQQGTIVLPAWHRTHALSLQNSALQYPGEPIPIMACVDPGKTERRYQLYQRGEYDTAGTLMAASTASHRCLAEAEFELYLGQLYRRQIPWTRPFKLF